VANAADANADNSGTGGGAYSDSPGTFNVRNTLLAGNYGSTGFDDCAGVVNTYGQNLFGTTDGCTVNIVSGVNANLNSLDTIGNLQDNGGPTWTLALLSGSTAIDWEDPSQGCVNQNSIPLETDQRGVPRVVGASCDIGAFEYLPPVAYLPFIRR
jgi:hypothetical protein